MLKSSPIIRLAISILCCIKNIGQMLCLNKIGILLLAARILLSLLYHLVRDDKIAVKVKQDEGTASVSG